MTMSILAAAFLLSFNSAGPTAANIASPAVPAAVLDKLLAGKHLGLDTTRSKGAVPSSEIFASDHGWTGFYNKRYQVVMRGRWLVKDGVVCVVTDAERTFCRAIRMVDADHVSLAGPQFATGADADGIYLVSVRRDLVSPGR